MNTIQKIVLSVSLILTASCLLIYHYSSTPKDGIYDFSPTRDTKDMMDIFNKNRYWLLASDDSSPAFMLKYRTWDANPAHFGKMRIKVLRENDKVVGFTTYHMETPERGRLLFLVVDESARGKGYGTMLAKLAMKELFTIGAEYVVLWTRVSNIRAQRIYRELGFKEKREENEYLYFEYWPTE